jgi:hypothetical protein
VFKTKQKGAVSKIPEAVKEEQYLKLQEYCKKVGL